MIKFLYRLLTGEYFNLYVGGGGGQQQQPQPTTTTQTMSNLPAWAQPYSEQLLGKAQALTDIDQNKYQSYTGDRLAGFTPMQQQAFQNIGGMQVSPQTGQATGLAGLAGMGSLGAGANYMNMATNPAAIQAFMSPYQQNVTDWQKQQAISDYGRQLPGLGAGASQAGAFGGTRHALVESEAQRNLQNQLAGIQATGSQNAFNAAQQAQQFGAGLGLQGYGQALQGAQTLGQLGQQQYQQQMGINAAQQQAGAQQQAMNQQQLTNQYQDWLNRQNYPYQQLAFMSDILHGTPTGGVTTQQQYQAAPSMFSQIAGLGLGLGALGKGFNLFKEGGEIKGYKGGGKVGYADGGLPQLAGMDVDMADPTTELGVKSQLQKAQMGQQPIVPLQTLMALHEGIQKLHTPEAQPQTTTVAQDLAKQVLAQSEPGVAGLPTDEGMFTAANGGIVAFDEGGEVYDYKNYYGPRTPGVGFNEPDPRSFGAGVTQGLKNWWSGLTGDVARLKTPGAYKGPYEAAAMLRRSENAMENAPALKEAVAGIPAALSAVAAPTPEPALTAAPTAARPTATAATQKSPRDIYDQAIEANRKQMDEARAMLLKQAGPEAVKSQDEYLNQAVKLREDALKKQGLSTDKEFFDKRMGELTNEATQARKDRDTDRWLALAKGAFAMGAGKSQYAMQNLAVGLGVTTDELKAAETEFRKGEKARKDSMFAMEQARRVEALGYADKAEALRTKAQDRNEKWQESQSKIAELLMTNANTNTSNILKAKEIAQQKAIAAEQNRMYKEAEMYRREAERLDKLYGVVTARIQTGQKGVADAKNKYMLTEAANKAERLATKYAKDPDSLKPAEIQQLNAHRKQLEAFAGAESEFTEQLGDVLGRFEQRLSGSGSLTPTGGGNFKYTPSTPPR